MKRLTLMRHAQADDPLSGQQDWDRPLTHRGLLDAATMAKRLKAARLKPDLLLVSPALRTRQTAEAFSKVFPHATVHFIDDLYLAERRRIKDVIRQHAGDAHHVLVIAHNPGISEAADRLSQERRIEAMPTGSWMTAEFDLAHWCDLRPDSGTNVDFDYPQRKA